MLQLLLLLLACYAGWRFSLRRPWLHWVAAVCTGLLLLVTLEGGPTGLLVRVTGAAGLLLTAANLTLLVRLRQEERLRHRGVSRLRQQFSRTLLEAEAATQEADTQSAQAALHEVRAATCRYTSARLDRSLRGVLLEAALLTLSTVAVVALALARQYEIGL